MEGTISEIRLFAGNFAPKSWALCQGQILPINTNQALFSLLGTNYGGDGRTTFALPNFAGRIAMGTGQAAPYQNYVLGQMSGSPTNTCLLTNMPMHTHTSISETATINAYSDGGSEGIPTNNNLASVQGLYSNENPDTSLRPITTAFNLSATGGSQPINVQQPFLGLNYIICIYGIYPSRN